VGEHPLRVLQSQSGRPRDRGHVIPSLSESPYLDAQMARVRLGEIASAHASLATAPNVVVEMGSPANMILKVEQG
jgi:hypothetical protein